jgi:hypothetical protein
MLPNADSYLYALDRVGYSHRTIDTRRKANGDRRVSVRVTQAQYAAIVDRAKFERLSVAEYVRFVLGVNDMPNDSAK